MRRIALLTIHNTCNYGAVLQASAMQIVLSRYGYVELVNYNNRHVARDLDLVRFKPTIRGMLGTVKDILRLLPRRKVINKFLVFMDHNLNLTKIYSKNELSGNELEGYDYYIAGSDQIWNPECISQNSTLDPVYFLEFAPKGKCKISYASSLGSYRYSTAEKRLLKKYLSDFSVVSVREKGGQELLQKVLGRSVYHVLDPTLLLSKDDWLENFNLALTPNSEGKYILLYSVPKTPLLKKVVSYYSKKLGLKVIAVDQGLIPSAKVDRHIRDAGPFDFLRLFLNAEIVITDSFHGVCFSLNFEKLFVAVAPGKYTNRISSLLSVVELESQMVTSSCDLDKVKDRINYVEAGCKLSKARNESVAVLCESFSSVGKSN